MGDTPTSVLDGLDAVIDRYLLSGEEFPQFQYHQKRSYKAISKNPPEAFDGLTMISAMYKCIEANLSKRPKRIPSLDNWSLRSNHDSDSIKTSQQNVSEEVTLERAIVQKWPKNWTYQMPVASGLFGSRTDKRRAVDLVYDHKNGRYDFVELKIKSDNPLYAAMEILGYGLVYLASRQDRAKNLGYDSKALPVLGASEIALCVLAPQAYYENCNLRWLEIAINDGLAVIATDGLKMKFNFEQFFYSWKSGSSHYDLPTQMTREPVCV